MGDRVRRRIGMYEYDRSTTLQFIEDRLQHRVAQIYTGRVREERESIEPEDVKCVRQLLQGRVDIRQRDTGKTCKPVRPSADELGREFVAPARQSRSFGTVPRMHAGCTHRENGEVYPAVVHEDEVG